MPACSRHLLAIGVDIGPVENCHGLVDRLFRLYRPSRVGLGQDRIRQLCNAACVGAEILVREGVVEKPHLLTRTDEPCRAGRDQQLRLQRAAVGHDLELQALRLYGLSLGELQHRDAPRARRPDHV